jgi:F0F1-type ATP synthase membrane subunit b/b'
MTTILLIVVLLLGGALAITYFLKRRVEGTVAAARQQAVSAQQQRDAAIANAQAAYEQKVAELDAEAERIRAQYEAEARKIADEANSRVAELEPLRGYAALKDAETEVQKILADAVAEATALRQEAKKLLDQTQEAAGEERIRARQRVKEIGEQADALLTQATRDAGRIVADAEKRAEQIGGDAYTALRDKQLLEQAAAAMRNVIEGYGDRYIIPTHSVLDDLAIEFGYDAAGASLKSAREQSRRMVEQGEAAACDYVEANRREIAIRFVIDAFNGRVDAILSRAKHDNYGTLEQEIRDAFSLVNFNGHAFRNARILPSYLDARLAELKWAVVVQELARKQREEQRYLKERLRDEEKARKEYEEKMRQAAKEEELKKRAVEEAEQRFASATTEQKAHYEQELQKLRQELADATQRALTIAQQTKKGHVYIISNVGSFGEGVYKIGQTRRPEPQDRVDELGDASVPFEFDIHALIESENAPALEHKLHKQLLALQVNKINSRKEFFRVSLADIHQEIEKLNEGEDFTIKVWSEKAIATEYRDSLDIENDPQKKENWIKRQQALSTRQLQLDMLKFPVLSSLDTDEDNQET